MPVKEPSTASEARQAQNYLAGIEADKRSTAQMDFSVPMTVVSSGISQLLFQFVDFFNFLSDLVNNLTPAKFLILTNGRWAFLDGLLRRDCRFLRLFLGRH